jgi:hypothetical protein
MRCHGEVVQIWMRDLYDSKRPFVAVSATRPWWNIMFGFVLGAAMSQGPVPGSGGPWGTPAPFHKGRWTICSPDGTAYAHGGGPSEFFRGVRWNGSRAGAWACASTTVSLLRHKRKHHPSRILH